MNIGFQLIPNIINQNPNFSSPNNVSNNNNNNNNAVSYPRDFAVSKAPFMSYSWLNHHNKFFNNIPCVSDTYMTQPMQLLLQAPKPGPCDEEAFERRQCTKKLKAKKERKIKDSNSVQRSPLRKRVEMVINGVSMDIGCLPVPVCSCTGLSQPCYRWGCGGWQSACCTTNVSVYPLPMSSKKRGARIAGRKMSQGAFRKVLERLSNDGFDFSKPIDLKSHWAKHGTNKFVTIR
ncbi:unnamed protein product [Cochlearia groenlandica]